MTGEWWRDDDRLLDALAGALRAADVVPRSFVEAGKATYAWHNVDAELAALTYDSSRDQPAQSQRSPAGTESASLLALTFTASQLTIELELNGDALLGQLVPPQSGEVELHVARGLVSTTPIDDVGYFLIRPIPAAPFRLHCRTDSGPSALTNWITL
ncbi:MAG TPA: hypothetical protein VFX70_19150 [Mycobacteriales bacterium]|nr:hypothetical protein [Mycobacteriales bacterium]